MPLENQASESQPIGGLVLMPERASTSATQVDQVFTVFVGVTGAILTLVVFLVLYFGIKYRVGSKASREGRPKRLWLYEVIWIGGPTVLGIALFLWSAYRYVVLTTPPKEAETVYVVGKQWMWKLEHENGRREINELHIALGQPVRLVLQSQDVIHSFYVPAFRLKQDAVPGRFTSLWVKPTRLGTYPIFCAEYCGAEHAMMRGTVYVMSPAEYQRWLSTESPSNVAAAVGTPGPLTSPLAVQGRGPFFQLGCNACHLPGAAVRAPRLDGLFGQEIALRNGQRIIADEQYIQESILEPNAKIASGYPWPSLMPTYKGQVTDEQLVQLVEFIRSLRNGWPADVVRPSASAQPADSLSGPSPSGSQQVSP